MWKKELKSFYMKQMDDGTVASADLELPGIGETFGMSQREDDYKKLLVGFERLLIYITGIKNIRDVIPYLRTYGSCEY